jgi:hypothetical protein
MNNDLGTNEERLKEILDIANSIELVMHPTPWGKTRVARMRFIEAVELMLNFKSLSTASNVRHAYATEFGCPEYAARLTDEDLILAIESCSRKAGRPKGNVEPKFVALAGILERICLGGVKADSLEDDWEDWKKVKGGKRFPAFKR